MTKSNISNEFYLDEDMVFFRNLYQSIFYIQHEVYPKDMFCDSQGKLVMVFNRQEHKNILPLWINNKEIDNKSE